MDPLLQHNYPACCLARKPPFYDYDHEHSLDHTPAWRCVVHVGGQSIVWQCRSIEIVPADGAPSSALPFATHTTSSYQRSLERLTYPESEFYQRGGFGRAIGGSTNNPGACVVGTMPRVTARDTVCLYDINHAWRLDTSKHATTTTTTALSSHTEIESYWAHMADDAHNDLLVRFAPEGFRPQDTSTLAYAARFYAFDASSEFGLDLLFDGMQLVRFRAESDGHPMSPMTLPWVRANDSLGTDTVYHTAFVEKTADERGRGKLKLALDIIMRTDGTLSDWFGVRVRASRSVLANIIADVDPAVDRAIVRTAEAADCKRHTLTGVCAPTACT